MSENAIVTKDHFKDLRQQIVTLKEENKSIVFDYELDETEARSHVASMRKKKTAISKLHKEKKSFFLEEGRKLDTAKNELIKDVDEMIEVHAKPLQDIKDKKDREIEAERLKVEQEKEAERLKAEQILIDREKEIERKEAEFKKIEDDRIAKEKAEQEKKIRLEREELLKKEAAENAKRQADEAVRAANEKAEREILEAQERENKLKREAEELKQHRIDEIRIAEEKAELAKQAALTLQRLEQEKKERLERERIAEEKRIADQKAANRNHQKAVNNKVLKKLLALGIEEQIIIDIITDIVKNPIPEITINY